MPELVAVLVGLMILIASMAAIGLARHRKKQLEKARQASRPLSAYELHRQLYEATGNLKEKDLMYQEYDPEKEK